MSASTLPMEDGFDDLLPSTVPEKYASVPAELRASKSWLTFKFEPGKDGKKDKVPYDPTTGKKANNPALGVTFEVACAAEATGKYDGLGFYVEAPYIVIDIDGCVTPATGDVELYACEIVQELNSYTEASPSGTGLHIWVRGVKPGDKCRKGIEIYSAKRFPHRDRCSRTRDSERNPRSRYHSIIQPYARGCVRGTREDSRNVRAGHRGDTRGANPARNRPHHQTSTSHAGRHPLHETFRDR